MKIVCSFWTFQGEGYHSGRRALFIRLPFCNLQCPWCDTEFNTFKEVSEEEMVKKFNEEKARFAVVTGGEPTKSAELATVLRLLRNHGFEIAIESNGTYPIPHKIDWVTVSPKRFQKVPYFIHDDAKAKAHEFKYVVDENFDFGILERHDVHDGRRYTLSPEWSHWQDRLPEIFNYIKEHPEWKISLQTHKFLNIP